MSLDPSYRNHSSQMKTNPKKSDMLTEPYRTKKVYDHICRLRNMSLQGWLDEDRTFSSVSENAILGDDNA